MNVFCGMVRDPHHRKSSTRREQDANILLYIGNIGNISKKHDCKVTVWSLVLLV